MKSFVVLLLAAAAAAKPSGITAPLVATPLIAASPVSTQYHSQDGLGQYSYGYSNVHSAKAEARSLDGITVGGYTYIDPAGKVQTVEYSSDVNGFRVAASNLPVPPAVPVAPVLPLPVPVGDTPEVVEARAKHLEALEAAKVRSTEVIAPAPAPAPAVSTVVQSISPLVAGLPAPLAIAGASPFLAAKSIIPTASVVAGSPLVAATSASAEAPQPPAAAAEAAAPAPSTEAPPAPAAAEEPTTAAPLAEAKSAILPAGVSVLSVPTLGVRSLALPLGVPSVGATTYAINSLFPYGYTSVVAQPVATTYTAQYVASLPGSVVKTSQAWSPEGKTEKSSE